MRIMRLWIRLDVKVASRLRITHKAEQQLPR